MKRRPFAPDPFTLGLLAFGMLVFLFSSTRVAALVAVIAAVAYWVITGLLGFARNRL